jgi:three-Cys-motif partner protein
MPMRLVAADGLPARPSQPYAEEKLTYFERYLNVVARSMKGKWPMRAVVDLLAGPGRCILQSGHEFDGSPLIALQTHPAWTDVVFVEADPALADALDTRVKKVPTSSRVTILPGDCNDPAIIAKVRHLVPPNALVVVFVDMLGADVPFETLAQLTAHRRMDLLITFQVGDLRRNLRDALQQEGEGQRLDRFFGSRDWRQVAARPGDRIPDLTQFYEDRLRSLDYPHIGRSLDVMRNSRNVEQYRLLLASRHPLGPEFFEKIAAISPRGERRLF